MQQQLWFLMEIVCYFAVIRPICVQATEIPALGRAAVGNQMLKGNTLLSASKV